MTENPLVLGIRRYMLETPTSRHRHRRTHLAMARSTLNGVLCFLMPTPCSSLTQWHDISRPWPNKDEIVQSAQSPLTSKRRLLKRTCLSLTCRLATRHIRKADNQPYNDKAPQIASRRDCIPLCMIWKVQGSRD
ncbi:hypothetical protein LIA77_04562 [Sarocladium implicatum]|nr:hypothetical protein LIA77_04562 [Sarocladium implicatum]